MAFLTTMVWKYISDMLFWIEDIWIAMFNFSPLDIAAVIRAPTTPATEPNHYLQLSNRMRHHTRLLFHDCKNVYCLTRVVQNICIVL